MDIVSQTKTKMKMNKTDHSFKGSERKFLLEISAPGFSMHDDNFEVTLKQNTTIKIFPKSELIEESYTDEGLEKYRYYLCFDTSIFERGPVTCIVRAYVPDTDFPDGLRTEIDKFDITIVEPV